MASYDEQHYQVRAVQLFQEVLQFLRVSRTGIGFASDEDEDDEEKTNRSSSSSCSSSGSEKDEIRPQNGKGSITHSTANRRSQAKRREKRGGH